ncbi:Membrane fusion protein of RND family multidrug efflux pump, partial [Salmonella enterica subsp. enterica serovar Minnesota str. A4-603]
DDTLFPNQFVNARMLVDTEQNAVVVPAAAVQMGNEGHFVWVLNDENNVSKKRVKIGIQDNRNVVISAGLSAGDRVVTDGIDRLTEGAKVEVVEPQTTVADEKSPSRHEGQKGARAAPDAGITSEERAPDAGITSGQHGRPFASVYSAPRGHHSADGGDFTRRDYRLSLPARRRFAGGRLPHYSGCYALPWRQPGCHDLRRHRAA